MQEARASGVYKHIYIALVQYTDMIANTQQTMSMMIIIIIIIARNQFKERHKKKRSIQ